MRKTLWTPMLVAAAAAVSFTTMWVVARQPADTASPPASTAPVNGMNMAGATQPTTAPTTQAAISSFSYSLGYNMGQNFKQRDFQADIAQIEAGLTDAIAGTPSKVSEEDVRGAIAVVSQALMEKEVTKNHTAGEAFLAQNKTAEGVKTTASGLQYKITQEGTGTAPTATDTVRVNYTGKLLDGTTFDSTAQRGEPIDIPLNRVIPGWTEGMQLLKPGGKATLWIPSNLAYGDQSQDLPPGSTLIFDVELVAVNPPPATQPAGGGMPGGLDMNGLPAGLGGAEPTTAPTPTP